MKPDSRSNTPSGKQEQRGRTQRLLHRRRISARASRTRAHFRLLSAIHLCGSDQRPTRLLVDQYQMELKIIKKCLVQRGLYLCHRHRRRRLPPCLDGVEPHLLTARDAHHPPPRKRSNAARWAESARRRGSQAMRRARTLSRASQQKRRRRSVEMAGFEPGRLRTHGAMPGSIPGYLDTGQGPSPQAE